MAALDRSDLNMEDGVLRSEDLDVGGGERAVLVRLNPLRLDAHGLQRLHEETSRRLLVSPGGEHDVEDLAVPVDGAVEVLPLPFYLKICFIDVPGHRPPGIPKTPAKLGVAAGGEEGAALPAAVLLIAEPCPDVSEDHRAPTVYATVHDVDPFLFLDCESSVESSHSTPACIDPAGCYGLMNFERGIFYD